MASLLLLRLSGAIDAARLPRTETITEAACRVLSGHGTLRELLHMHGSPTQACDTLAHRSYATMQGLLRGTIKHKAVMYRISRHLGGPRITYVYRALQQGACEGIRSCVLGLLAHERPRPHWLLGPGLWPSAHLNLQQSTRGHVIVGGW
jgi:hypothetical protein